MSKFDWIIGANEQETFWFSIGCDALAGQICHIRRTLEIALKRVVKGLKRGMNPAFRPFPRLFGGNFNAILTLFMGL